ncbi:MAG TPA: hypothetical protein VMB81_00725 [Candidatus Sulfotelmatobacter sp.]|nr:hypothetical protein [Candidatus Sulfotelmatobacter sp.]
MGRGVPAGSMGLAAVVLASCALPVWQKPGATREEFAQTRYQCQLQSASAAPVTPQITAVEKTSSLGGSEIYSTDVAAGTRDRLFRSCMEAAGWHLVRKAPQG